MRSWPALDIASRLPNPEADLEPPERATPDSAPGTWDLIQAALTDFDVAAIDEDARRVFFHTPDGRDRAAAALRREFHDVSVAAIEVADEDWAARSQANLTAVRVGHIIVAPPWDVGGGAGRAEALPNVTVVIQPSMGFGTGHHATTRLCLAHLQRLDLRNHTAVDVGTGSGVLAIAASRLGATHVLAIDDDPDAIQSARENMEMNPGAEVTLGLVDLRRTRLRPFDVVLANLTGGLLISAAPSLQALAAPAGRLILSGFMETEEAAVLKAFSSCTVDDRSQEDEWVCVTLRSRA